MLPGNRFLVFFAYNWSPKDRKAFVFLYVYNYYASDGVHFVEIIIDKTHTLKENLANWVGHLTRIVIIGWSLVFMWFSWFFTYYISISFLQAVITNGLNELFVKFFCFHIYLQLVLSGIITNGLNESFTTDFLNHDYDITGFESSDEQAFPIGFG